MKALYKTLLLCVSLSFVLIGCDDSTEIPSSGPLDHAEELALGTYVGEWTILNTTDSTSVIYPGTVSLDPYTYINKEDVEVTEHNANRVNVTVDGNADIYLESNESACNTQLNSAKGITFWNLTSSNPFGVTYWGKVSTTGNLILKYEALVRTGRGGKNITKYSCSFSGDKQ